MGYIGQAEDEWEAEQRKKARKAKLSAMEACPVCGKKTNNVHHHARDVHGVKLQLVDRPKYEVTK